MDDETDQLDTLLDNCDFLQEHLTVEVVEKETIDTSNLSTIKMSKEEALKLFSKDQVLLGCEENKEEREHLLEVIGIAVGKILAANRTEAKKLADHLPAHHHHKKSHLKPTPALTFIVKPYPYQETKNPDVIKLLIRIQRKFILSVAKAQGNRPDFLEKIRLLEDVDAEEAERKEAEQVVMEEVLKFGVWIGSGDLLTVKMIQEATMLMAGSATAFGRLEFLGPFRLQLLHMKMKKICQDFAATMKHEINFDDKLSVPWLTALSRMKISNKAKDIKNNDSTFERHDQFMASVQTSYLANMFDNYMVENSEILEEVTDQKSAVKFVLGMLDSFGVQIYYDPSMADPEKKEGEDDMFVYCKDMVERFLLSLCFDVCEQEGDAEGLRALR